MILSELEAKSFSENLSDPIRDPPAFISSPLGTLLVVFSRSFAFPPEIFFHSPWMYQRNLLDFVYGDIARQLRDLEIAMYNEDREEMQEIIREIHKAITEVQTNR